MAEKTKKAFLVWMRILKWIVLTIGAILVMAVLAATVCYLKYSNIEKKNIPAETVTAIHYSLEADTATLGEEFHAEMTIRLPWNKTIGEIKFGAQDGLQETGQPHATRDKAEFGFFLWKITLPMQTYYTFEKLEKPGTVTVNITSKSGTDTMVIALPPLSSVFTPSRASNTPETAPKLSELPPKQDLRKWIVYGIIALLVVLLIIGGICYLCNRNKHPERPKTVVQLTLEQLQLLREDFDRGRIPVKVAISKLTLILRAFFELRFQMPAERQTTEEFLRRIRYEQKRLTAEQQYFLEDFLHAADMVKYANMPSNETTFKIAMDNVERLVKSASDQDIKDKTDNNSNAN